MAERLRIMVVDDEPDIPAVIRPLLEPEFEVVVATNGLDALLKLPRCQPDMMIIDLMMPLMDGWDLAHAVRQNEEFKATPIIFLTALDSREDIRRGYESGANVYLTKPFDPDRLMKNLRVFVDRDKLQPRPKASTIEDIRKGELQSRQEERRAGRTTEVAASPSPEVVRKVGAPRPEPRAMPQAPGVAAAPPPPEPAPASARQPPAPGILIGGTSKNAPPRILVVDDDPEIGELIRMTLERGFEVVVAYDGLDALNKIPVYEPDIYVIDGMMPKMSGFQLLQMLRTSAETRRAPVLFISAKAEPKDRTYAVSLGANEFLSKPFAPEKMIEVLSAFTSSPSFKTKWPKRRTLHDLLRDETRRVEEEQERRHSRSLRVTQQILGEFLRKHGDKEPL